MTTKRLQFYILVLLFVGLITVSIIIRDNQSPSSNVPGLEVTTSFYPLAEFAKEVGGEKVKVTNLVPPGTEPHDFEPSTQEIAKVYSADLFIFNGGGLDHWAEKLASELEEKGVRVINISQHFDLLKAADDPGGTGNTDQTRGSGDPHIWLDPVLAQEEIRLIRDVLKQVDPKNNLSYEANAQRYLERLSTLDGKYRNGLRLCSLREIVASHAAFGYLARRYDLSVINIVGFSPEEDPSPKKLAEVTQLIRQKKIGYIFFETLVSPKIAETIAREAGVQTLVFNPVEGLTEEELAVGQSYITIMEENLSHLRQALSCQ